MSFRDFSYPEVLDRLGLNEVHEPLFSEPAPVPVSSHTAMALELGIRLYGATTSEKARSEFLIAPVLFELQLRYQDRFRLFSGVELSADPEHGLNGICDFVFSKGKGAYAVTAPIVAVAEAKPDVVTSGFGQCIAGMRAAWIVNERKSHRFPVYGVSTTGIQWKFLQLTDTTVVIDPEEYFIHQSDRVLGMLSHMIETATS